MSSAKRLAALEVAAQQDRQRRIDLNDRIFGRAIHLLPDGAVKALLESDEARVGDPERCKRVAALGQAVCTGPLPDPASSEALKWAGVTVWGTAEDAVLTKPPSGAADYLTAEALDWERALREAVDPSEDFDTVARWYGAAFHFEAAVARVLEES